MRLILVRHGLARSNLPDPSQCPYDKKFEPYEAYDVSLTPQGEEQATLSGIRLKDIKIDHVFCSPFHRAISTCAGILREQKEHLQIEINHELVEVGSHGFSPMPMELINTIWDDVVMTPAPSAIPEETDEKRFDRADRFVNMLYNRFGDTDKTILIVSHGHFLHQYLIPSVLMLPRAIRGRYRFAAENAAISVINYENGVYFSLAIDETAQLGDKMSRDSYLL